MLGRLMIPSLVVASTLQLAAQAQILDPEAHIRSNGHHSARMGDDGVTRFYSATERAGRSRISKLEAEVAALPRRLEVFQVCDHMRGSVKARLWEERRKPYDVAAPNYGYSGSTIACVLKYMHEGRVGTQIIYMKKSAAGMYMLFVTD